MRLRNAVSSLLVSVVATTLGCQHFPAAYNVPPADRLMHPGPGVDGPGPGVLIRGGAAGPVQAAQGLTKAGLAGCNGPISNLALTNLSIPTSQVAFVGPSSVAVQWDLGGYGAFDSEPLICPGRQNFPQGAIYRLKLSNIPGRAGLELYPTLEIGPATPRTDAYLAHTPIPVQFTEEDFDQVVHGNFVTKVIYLPDPEFQDLALAGVETLVSTRLDPGIDPIVEADRRGSILAIVRIGNKDLELPAANPGFAGRVVPATHLKEGAVPFDGAVPCEGGAACGPPAVGGGVPSHGGPTTVFAPPAWPPQFVTGATGPQWGMPISGTPIGLPGPPHVPLGVPAGLQKHVIKNRTISHIPDPVKKFKIDVKQIPGFSYPKPPRRMSIKESIRAPWPGLPIPWKNKHEIVKCK